MSTAVTDIRFADLQLLRYTVEGFPRLTLQQKLFVYYLSGASLWGRDILWDQNGRLGWFDLALFGHTHGGQIPFLSTLLNIGADVDDGQIKVYSATTLDALKDARPLDGGVTITEKKSAVKTTVKVVPEAESEQQFFKVEFGK